jgi:hypothetical protein
MPIGSGSLADIHVRYGDVDARVQDLGAAVRRGCERRVGETDNGANERLVEEFIAWLHAAFPGRTYEVHRQRAAAPFREEDQARWRVARGRTDAPCVVIERQRLSAWAIRTTRWNYLFTVPGEGPDQLVLVAHYDTWRGPGADDNTTGEEILKQYLLADLRAGRRPPLTHTYFLAGSEECGLVGMMSQVLLAFGLVSANLALAGGHWIYAAVALALCPLASYRFGVSGSREYVRTLSTDELSRIRAVVSVDSVGEGRMYIPRSTLGADFVRAIIPFEGFGSLNELLEEGAHLHGLKYNNYIAGGTTDHVSFLEVNNGLRHRVREAIAGALARLRGRPHRPLLRLPASALVAMGPGKASPFVFGGKIHTRRDVPERVYPGPLREALLVLDHLFHRLEGGERVREPRDLHEYHYARLYLARGGDHYLVLKDAIEPNRRNLNGVYRARATVEGRRAVAHVGEIVAWGVETRLRDQAAGAAAERGEAWSRVPVEELEVVGGGLRLRFARRRTVRHFFERIGRRAVAAVERAMGRFSFLAFFATAWLVAELVARALTTAVVAWPALGVLFFAHVYVSVPLVLAFQVGATLYLMMRPIPTWIDNAYRNENRADNLGSLRRVASAAGTPGTSS